MKTHADKTSGNKSNAVAGGVAKQQSNSKPVFQLPDTRPEAIAQMGLQEMANNSTQLKQLNAYQAMADRYTSQTVQRKPVPVQKKQNNTGLPDSLKSGIENLSGYSLADVRVHFNSSQPAQLNAHAYTQGTDIHVAPGQERHLAHEAWHVVQQKQGRVDPTVQMKEGMYVNDDAGLEREADVMGEKAAQFGTEEISTPLRKASGNASLNTPIQRMLVGIEMETNVPIYENGERPDHVDGYARQTSEYAHENVDETLRQPLGKGFELHVDSSAHRTPNGALDAINPAAKMHIMEIVSKPVASRDALLLKLQIARNFLKVLASYREVTGDEYSIGWPVPSDSFRLKEGEKAFPQDKLEELFRFDYEAGKGRNTLYSVASQLTFQVPPDHLKHISGQDTFKYDTGRKKTVTKVDKMFVRDKETREMIKKETTRNVREAVIEEHPLVDRTSMARAMLLSGALDNEYVRRVVDIAVKIFKDTLKFIQGGISGTVKNSVSYLVRSNLGALFPGFPPDIANQMGKNAAAILELTTIDELNIPKPLLAKIYDKGSDALILNPHTFVSITNPTKREEGELEHISPSLRHSLKTTAINEGELWPWKAAMKWLGSEVRNAISQGEGDVTGPLHGSRNLGLLPERNQQSEIEELSAIEAVNRKWLEHPEVNPYPGESVPTGKHDLGPAQPGVVVEDRAGVAIDIGGDNLPTPVTERLDLMGFPK